MVRAQVASGLIYTGYGKYSHPLKFFTVSWVEVWCQNIKKNYIFPHQSKLGTSRRRSKPKTVENFTDKKRTSEISHEHKYSQSLLSHSRKSSREICVEINGLELIIKAHTCLNKAPQLVVDSREKIRPMKSKEQRQGCRKTQIWTRL